MNNLCSADFWLTYSLSLLFMSVKVYWFSAIKVRKSDLILEGSEYLNAIKDLQRTAERISSSLKSFTKQSYFSWTDRLYSVWFCSCFNNILYTFFIMLCNLLQSKLIWHSSFLKGSYHAGKTFDILKLAIWWF